ncbi:MAG: hypothetical protein NWQ55_09340, partial [Salibacteraceae bacterium]|nr:hypothetical protein [Salibacteraceae bacterium]
HRKPSTRYSLQSLPRLASCATPKNRASSGRWFWAAPLSQTHQRISAAIAGAVFSGQFLVGSLQVAVGDLR